VEVLDIKKLVHFNGMMVTAQHLQTIFEELDYLDDGFQVQMVQKFNINARVINKLRNCSSGWGCVSCWA